MPGKWSGLRGAVPAAPVDGAWQDKVNAAKSAIREDLDERSYYDLSKTDKARAFCKLRDMKDELEEQISAINVDLEALSQLMILEMEREGSDLFRLQSGDSLSIKDEPYCSVADKDAFLKWIKEQHLEDLLTVHYMTLSSMTKDRLVQGLNAPPGIKVFLKQSITRRRARG